jgi:hypothetical protein
MTYLKHKDGKGKRPKPTKSAEPTNTAPVVSVDADMSGIEVELANIAHSLKSYNANACDGEMSLGVGLTTWDNHKPVRLALEGDAVDSIADSLKRIADALKGRSREQQVLTGLENVDR